MMYWTLYQRFTFINKLIFMTNLWSDSVLQFVDEYIVVIAQGLTAGCAGRGEYSEILDTQLHGFFRDRGEE
jgi:hypothetical protein